MEKEKEKMQYRDLKKCQYIVSCKKQMRNDDKTLTKKHYSRTQKYFQLSANKKNKKTKNLIF
jgi:hypothetical protein